MSGSRDLNAYLDEFYSEDNTLDQAIPKLNELYALVKEDKIDMDDCNIDEVWNSLNPDPVNLEKDDRKNIVYCNIIFICEYKGLIENGRKVIEQDGKEFQQTKFKFALDIVAAAKHLFFIEANKLSYYIGSIDDQIYNIYKLILEKNINQDKIDFTRFLNCRTYSELINELTEQNKLDVYVYDGPNEEHEGWISERNLKRLLGDTFKSSLTIEQLGNKYKNIDENHGEVYHQVRSYKIDISGPHDRHSRKDTVAKVVFVKSNEKITLYAKPLDMKNLAQNHPEKLMEIVKDFVRNCLDNNPKNKIVIKSGDQYLLAMLEVYRSECDGKGDEFTINYTQNNITRPKDDLINKMSDSIHPRGDLKHHISM